MRTVDVALGIPPLIFALVLVGILGAGFGNLLFALGVAYLAYYTRLARGIALSARTRPDVIAARLAGVRYPRVVLSHVVPRVLAQLGVVATLDVGTVIVSIAGFSFLGLGIQPPAAEWGSMLSESRGDFSVAPRLLTAPALAIMLTVAGANLVGDALRDGGRP
jgi:ABC-type dipeptide/oligopeptide/nickel transport system permease subunit